MRVGFTVHGSYKNIDKWLKKNYRLNLRKVFDKYGQIGSTVLMYATPRETGNTALSWTHKVTETQAGITLSWHNTNVVDGVPIAIILQYGHGTGTGGYVQGQDYINPAMRPVFEEIASILQKAVTE